jgi:hypothetical protein
MAEGGKDRAVKKTARGKAWQKNGDSADAPQKNATALRHRGPYGDEDSGLF